MGQWSTHRVASASQRPQNATGGGATTPASFVGGWPHTLFLFIILFFCKFEIKRKK
jgi:hypothetical protein